MAKRYLGLTRGNQIGGAVTEDASTTSKSIELVIDLADTALTKSDVLLALENLENYVTQRNWPLA